MAKVKITGHASGTGVITVTAPNTSTDRTITLPDATATIATTADVAAKASLTGAAFTGNCSLTTSGDSVFEIVAGNASNSQIRFSDAAGSDRGRIHYEHGDDSLIFKNNGANNLRIYSDGRGVSQFTAKAWVNFNGTGTVAIRDSHNVSSIADNAVGDYSVLFDVNMANANFAGAGLGATDGEFVSFRNGIAWNAAGYARVAHKNTSNTYTDGDTLTFIFFGD